MLHELETARELARHAGAILLDHYSRKAEVEWKAGGGPVTAADRAVNDYLVHEIRQRFPGDAILSEEQAADPSDANTPRAWIVDPMDGTREFIDRNGEFSVMIGFAIDGIPVAGAVYQPTEDKLWSAAAGGGAFLTRSGAATRLVVSPESDPARLIAVFSRSHQSPDIQAACDRAGVSQSIRSGSIGIKVGLICEGRAHLYMHLGTHVSQWDTCAANILLREAGGRITGKSGEPLVYGGREHRHVNGVIASNGPIHNALVRAAGS